MKFFEIFKDPLGQYSIGRIAFAIFFLAFLPIYFYRWIHLGQNEIHPSVLTLFGTLLGYNFGQKIYYGSNNYQKRLRELQDYKESKDDI